MRHPQDWALILLGFGGFVMAGVFDEMNFLWAGIFLLFAGIIYGVATVRIVWPARIDDKFAWVKGINKDYLNELPQWPGV